MLETLNADLRFASRILRKSPVFAIVSVLCISIGAGAVTTIFSAMNALVLRPLPGAADASRLVRLERKRPGGNDGVSASYVFYNRLRTRTRSLDGIAAWGHGSFAVRTPSDDGGEVYGGFVTGNFFDVLGVRPALGRFFAADEDRVELERPVVVISERLWRARLHADQNAIGGTLLVNSHPYTIIGVAPAVFEGVDAPIATSIWIPLAMERQFRPRTTPLATSTEPWLRLSGRLRAGVTTVAAHRELAALTQEFVNDEGATWKQYSDLQLSPLTGLPPDASGPLSIFLGLLLGAAGLVLLIASVNVASMLSARALARRREMAVRAALGASRGRLVRQLLTEILVLFLLGAGGGIGLAVLATRALPHLDMPISVPIVLELSPDWRVLSFALAVSLLTGLVFGLTPALQAADRDIAARVRDGSAGSGTRRGWASNALVGGQLALSLVLLVGAGLFVRALDRGNRIDPGFDARGVATAQFNTDSWAYDETRARAFYHDLRERVAALPGVTAVSYTEYLPLTTRSEGAMVKVDGSVGPATDATNGMYSGRLDVDAGYFDALRTTIVAGRAIDRTDDASAPKVAVVNETFVRRTWPGQSAVGRTVGYQGDRVTVVGVARDAKYSTLTEPLRPFLYLPIAQHWSATQTLVVRASGDPLALAPDIARAVRAIDPTLPRPTVTTLGRENSVALIPQRVAALVSGTLGAVGLLLAAVGLYGVISHSSSRRRREIGIRLALGARRGDVLRMILREGMRVTAIGVAIGLVLSTAATRLLVRYLFGVSPLDALTFVGMSAMFVGIAALASYLPARRAASLSPMLTLRDE